MSRIHLDVRLGDPGSAHTTALAAFACRLLDLFGVPVVEEVFERYLHEDRTRRNGRFRVQRCDSGHEYPTSFHTIDHRPHLQTGSNGCGPTEIAFQVRGDGWLRQ